VKGLVANVHVSSAGNIFFNFGRSYPNQTFSAVIFSSAAPLFKNPQQWQGRMVVVRGMVKLYKGHPEVILESPAQLSAVQ
jgi:DNA/RNA endonuclease YhcR with UshA esterase domain